MFFLFGWGHTIRKDIGPAFSHVCAHCHNEALWEVQRISVWFTLFFIPVFPYEWKYFLYCPVCTYGVILDQAQRKEIVPLAQANKLLLTGKISELEHQLRINALTETRTPTDQGGLTVEAEPITPSTTTRRAPQTANKVPRTFCTRCGNRLESPWKFCNGCGSNIA